MNLERKGSGTYSKGPSLKEARLKDASTNSPLASLSIKSLVEKLGTDIERGIENSELDRLLNQYGPNSLGRRKSAGTLELVASQFKSTVIVLLSVASLISSLAGEHLQAAAILLAVFVNALVGFFTEYRARVSLQALENLAGPRARVRRSGQDCEIPVANLVPGDIVILDAGSRVPADLRLVKSGTLSVDESALTGESVPVYKSATVNGVEAVEEGLCYQGSMVLQGHGKAVVMATGGETMLGHLGIQLSEIGSGQTPLEKNLEKMGQHLSLLTLIICAVILVVGILHNEDLWPMLQTSTALAVAAIPEGLPVVATLALALGTQRMVSKGALIRRLSAVETLGCTQIICTDKTGTLTKNEMVVKDIIVSGRHFKASGEGYSPEGAITEEGVPLDCRQEPLLKHLLKAVLLCNDARLENHEGKELWHVHGDPTEGALIALGGKCGLDHKDVKAKHPRLSEFSFDLSRKRMTTVHSTGEAGFVSYVKGSPESVLAVSSQVLSGSAVALLDQETRSWFLARNNDLAAAGLRVLAVAFKELKVGSDLSIDEAESDLCFLGLVAMEDQAKPGVKQSIEHCQKAGIKVIMLTGDQSATAMSIATELGILPGKFETGSVMSGEGLEKLPESELKKVLEKSRVLARVRPEMKLSIVRSLQDSGFVVAMTGDGVNDAAALRQADIGIAMGQAGTAMARDSSDMVITDDNFATIVGAIEEGRSIYKNISCSIAYLLTASLTSVIAVAMAVLLGAGLPLSPLQLLWLNLIMHVFPALGLVLQPASKSIMAEPPRIQEQSILSRPILIQIFLRSLVVASITVVSADYYRGESVEQIRTVVLATISSSLLLQSWGWLFTNQKVGISIAAIGASVRPAMVLSTIIGFSLLLVAIYVPVFRQMLSTVSLGRDEWCVVVAFSMLSALLTSVPSMFLSRKSGRS